MSGVGNAVAYRTEESKGLCSEIGHHFGFHPETDGSVEATRGEFESSAPSVPSVVCPEIILSEYYQIFFETLASFTKRCTLL